MHWTSVHVLGPRGESCRPRKRLRGPVVKRTAAGQEFCQQNGNACCSAAYANPIPAEAEDADTNTEQQRHGCGTPTRAMRCGNSSRPPLCGYTSQDGEYSGGSAGRIERVQDLGDLTLPRFDDSKRIRQGLLCFV